MSGLNRRRKRIAAMLAIGCSLVFAGYAAPASSATSLPMGFAIERAGADNDWLGLSDPLNTTNPPAGKWAMVHSKLVKVHATWVNAHVGWGDLVDGATNGTYAKIQKWVSLAEQGPQPMNFLLSVDYHAPSDMQQPDCTLPKSGTTGLGNDAIDSVRSGLHGLYNYGDMSQLWPNMQLEIGTEPNQDGGGNCAINQRDAQLWWDIVNDVANSARPVNGDWYPGLGIVAGGVFTGTAPPGPGESPRWGTGSVDAKSWLEEGIHNDRAFPWEHSDAPHFDGYGVHAGHCAADSLTYRTRWDCNRGTNDRIHDVRSALVDTSQAGSTEIEDTALIVTQTDRPIGQYPALKPTWSQTTQDNDTTDIWNNLRSSYASYDNWPLTLVIWNHLVDSGQGLDRNGQGDIVQINGKDFGYAGWMRCDDDPFCGPDAQNSYTGKQLFGDASVNWTGIQSPW